jgi:hypothetical protein
MRAIQCKFHGTTEHEKPEQNNAEVTFKEIILQKDKIRVKL